MNLRPLLLPFIAWLLIPAVLSAAEPFRVGVILPLTGDVAAIGESIRNGMTLGEESLPPDMKGKIEFLFEDDGFQPARSVAAFNKLVSVDKVGAVITVGSNTSNAIAPLADARRIPHVAFASDANVSRGKSYVVIFWVTPEEEVRVLSPEMLKRKYGRVARISTIHDMNTAVNAEFDSKNGGKVEIIMDEEYPGEVKDFKPYINKLRAKKDVDAILAMLMPGQLGIFARQVREGGITLPLFGFEIFEDPNEIKASNGGLLGGWYATVGDATADFSNKYRSRFPKSGTFANGNGHDVIHLVAAGVKAGGDSEGLNKFLHEVKDFQGVLGKFSASGDNRFTLPAMLKVVTKDGVAPLS